MTIALEFYGKILDIYFLILVDKPRFTIKMRMNQIIIAPMGTL